MKLLLLKVAQTIQTTHVAKCHVNVQLPSYRVMTQNKFSIKHSFISLKSVFVSPEMVTPLNKPEIVHLTRNTTNDEGILF